MRQAVSEGVRMECLIWCGGEGGGGLIRKGGEGRWVIWTIRGGRLAGSSL